MAIDDQSRWDRQHAEGREAAVPSRFVQEILDSDHWTILAGRALDVATGKGRNALFLASRGFQVTAIDISTVGLEEGRTRARDHSLSIDWQQADLENLQLAAAAYDLIVNINYLQRSLLPGLRSALRPGGLSGSSARICRRETTARRRRRNGLLDRAELDSRENARATRCD